MSLVWSRIHAALGIDQGSLTEETLNLAIKEGVGEEADLDWKRALPGKREEERNEFAKDVAAMANSSGGLLVYGVEEERGTGRATSLVPVDASESSQRRLFGLAATRIHPMISGLELLPFADAEHRGVLVLSVPASADAPHLVGSGNRVGIPFRDGPDTRWMREPELERAYSERFRRRVSESQRLETLTDDLSDRLDLGRGAWIAAVATPRVPRTGMARDVSAQDVTDILRDSLDRVASSMLSESHSAVLLRDLNSAASNPRVGLRRWIVETRDLSNPDARSNMVHVEVHNDGSVSFTALLEEWLRHRLSSSQESELGDRHPVDVELVERFAIEFAALVSASNHRLGVATPMLVHLDLLREDDQPFAAVDTHRIGDLVLNELEQPAQTRTLRRFTPVLLELPLDPSQESARQSVADLAVDVLNQFGVEELTLIQEPTP